jgi:hypothetical protein
VSAPDFFVDFARTGLIYGLGLGTTPEQWSEGLGGGFISDVDKKHKQMRQDYGLVELTFSRKEESWRCFNISVQAHRLWWTPEGAPARVRLEYGAFPKFIRFADVCSKLNEFGFEPQLIDDKQISDHTRYYIPETKILIYVLSDDVAAEPDRMPPGTLWAMYLSIDAEVWAEPTRKTR